MDNAIHAQAGLSMLIAYIENHHDYDLESCVSELIQCKPSDVYRVIVSLDLQFLQENWWLSNFVNIIGNMDSDKTIDIFELKAGIKLIDRELLCSKLE